MNDEWKVVQTYRALPHILSKCVSLFHFAAKLLQTFNTVSVCTSCGKMLQDAERRFTGVLSCEEMAQAGYLGPYQESIVSMTRSCVLVSNILGQTCVYLSKGMARQDVRKSGHPFLCTSELPLSVLFYHIFLSCCF